MATRQSSFFVLRPILMQWLAEIGVCVGMIAASTCRQDMMLSCDVSSQNDKQDCDKTVAAAALRIKLSR